MFKMVRMHCNHESEEKRDAHLNMIRGKNGLDESNSGAEGLTTWWVKEVWVNEQVEETD